METLPESAAITAPLRRSRFAWVLVLLLMVLNGALWWRGDTRIGELQQHMSTRLSEVGDATQANHQSADDLRARTEAIEAQLEQARQREAALENLHRELQRSRDDRMLADVEHALTLAAQQIQLTGNAEMALAALLNADARLAGAAQPRLAPLRRLIARDIERLKALPAADLTGMTAKIEALAAGIDALPLLSERRPSTVEGAKSSKKPIVDETKGLPEWRRLLEEFWHDVRPLVRLERIDGGEQALLAPPQRYFLRENLKLRLLSARVALLQRDGKAYREALQQCRLTLERFFDVAEKPVQSAMSTINRLADVDLALNLPGLTATLAAAREARLSAPAN